MPGSLPSDFLWSRWRRKRSRHSQHMRNAQFYVSGKRSMMPHILIWWKQKIHLLSLYEEYVYHFMRLLTMFVTSLLNVFMPSSKRKLPTTSGNNILVQAKIRQPYMANRHRYVFCLDSKLRCYHPFVLTDQAPSLVNIFIALYTCSASCHLLSFS